MNNVNWSDSFVHDNIYDQMRSTDYENLSTHYDENNNLYLTVNNMIISRSLQYGNPNSFNNGGYIPNKNMNSSYYFTDSNIIDGNISLSYGTDSTIPNGIGGFTITDELGNNSMIIPFQTLTFTAGKYFQDIFNWLGDIWVIQYGWSTEGIFSFNIYQQTGQSRKFKINFTARFQSYYYNQSDYSNFGNISQSVKISDNISYNIYTHYHWFHASDANIKTTYTLIPYQAIGMTQAPLNIINQKMNYQLYLGYDRGTAYWACNNIEKISSVVLQYGCTLYLQWGKQIAGRTLETDVQDWIKNDLQIGANFKMCNYSNPIPMIDFIGQRTTREINISEATVYNNSIVSWDAITPSDSYVKIESNVSLDDGVHWMGWQEVTNGGEIPQLKNGINVSNGFIKFKETLYAPNENNLPKLYNLKLTIVSPVLKYLVADGEEIKTYVYNYDWVQYPYNATGYMETNTYPTPFIASCSSVFNTSYMAYKAFNHSNDNSYDCWVSQNGYTSGWLMYDFGENNSERLYKYIVSSRNNSDTNSAPKDWTLEVSNDNINWTVIDTQTNQINWSQKESRIFNLTMNTSYRYYKLNISSNNGNTAYVSIGELELYPLRYQIISGNWQTITDGKIDKSTFENYGFENIDDLDLSQLYLLNDVKLLVSIDNLYYAPHINYRGFKKVSVRDMVKIKETNTIINNWSNYSIEKYQSMASIKSKLIESIKPKTIQIITDTLDNDIIEKDLSLQLINDKPIIAGQMINTMLKYSISDTNGDKFHYNIKLNGTKVYPEIGDYTDWLKGQVNFKYTFTSKQYVVGKINTVEICVEDEYGAINSLLLTFKGEYGNIIFMDELGTIYNNDLGDTVQYINFGQIFSGNFSDIKKIIFQNKNGYAIKNVYITAAQPYENDKLEFSFSNSPFVPLKDLTFQQTFYPQQQSAFYIRINTSISDVSTSEMYTIKVSAEPIN